MLVTRVIAALVLGAIIGVLASEPTISAAYSAGLNDPRLAAVLTVAGLVATAAVLLVLLTYPFERAPKAVKAKP